MVFQAFFLMAGATVVLGSLFALALARPIKELGHRGFGRGGTRALLISVAVVSLVFVGLGVYALANPGAF